MWLRKKVGLFLYLSFSLALALLLLFAEEIDWFNIAVLTILTVALLLSFPYFLSPYQDFSDEE